MVIWCFRMFLRIACSDHNEYAYEPSGGKSHSVAEAVEEPIKVSFEP